MADFFRSIRTRWQSFIARENEKIKNMTRKQKWEYFATYYWLETFGILLGIGTVTFLIYMGVNLTKTNIFYLGVVDSSFTGSEYKAFVTDFKAYTGDPDRKHIVTADYGISSLGASKDASDEVYEYQEKSDLLVETGLFDAYLCPEVYVDYLLRKEDLCLISDILGDETQSVCGDRLALDGYAIELGGTKAETSGAIDYEPAYLVFTQNVLSADENVNMFGNKRKRQTHFPEVAKAFVHYLLEP